MRRRRRRYSHDITVMLNAEAISSLSSWRSSPHSSNRPHRQHDMQCMLLPSARDTDNTPVTFLSYSSCSLHCVLAQFLLSCPTKLCIFHTYKYLSIFTMASSLVSSLRIASRSAPLITSRSAIRPAVSFLNQQRNTFATTSAKMAVQGTSSGQPIATLDVRYP